MLKNIRKIGCGNEQKGNLRSCLGLIDVNGKMVAASPEMKESQGIRGCVQNTIHLKCLLVDCPSEPVNWMTECPCLNSMKRSVQVWESRLH